MSNYILTVTCPSRRGIVAEIAGYLSKKHCNISDSSQFDDSDTQRFFMRVSFTPEEDSHLEEVHKDFKDIAKKFSMEFFIRNTRDFTRTIIMVSRFSHCLHDLLYRWHTGTLLMDITGVVSNHLDHQKLVESYGIPFYYIPITPQNKKDSEKKLTKIIEKTDTELLILARYMQILSDEFCTKMLGCIINIHHSFLPCFKGANPYKQAFEYGVKLIGATAHYVTPTLDEGPIIEQDTIRVSHTQNITDYISIGKDVEAQVLARAVHAHINHRVFLNNKKTVVLPASPGSYSSR
ncbi:formyltetrahydrofolate deformylase [Candidatus Liberibacter sp.]|uniref:formyltetrahydrofolate deformylase n=1 Tax=Candidatus Liberibacter sp. TaxID=34022 RepID=UPI0015F57077|nr:formyltetrahydrofolate deformylase [Candidatus Liberibacter sp.]MBA5723731.1 formyltetrahydrofolate deformylase [Candidatus Liberibacter sp.]